MKTLQVTYITPQPPDSIQVCPKKEQRTVIKGGSKTYRDVQLAPHVDACLLKLQKEQVGRMADFQAEIDLIRSLQECPGVVRLFYSGNYTNAKGQSMPFAIYKKHPLSLQKALEERRPLDYWKVASSLLETLTFLHAKGIIHHDIKRDNILINEHDGTAVLIDFGSAIDLFRNSPSVDFGVLLSQVFNSFCRGCMTLRILPLQKDLKIGQNNPQNRRSVNFERGPIKEGVWIRGTPKYYAPEYLRAIDQHKKGKVDALHAATTDKIDCYAIGLIFQKFPIYKSDPAFAKIADGLLKEDPMQRLSAESALDLFTRGARC